MTSKKHESIQRVEYNISLTFLCLRDSFRFARGAGLPRLDFLTSGDPTSISVSSPLSSFFSSSSSPSTSSSDRFHRRRFLDLLDCRLGGCILSPPAAQSE